MLGTPQHSVVHVRIADVVYMLCVYYLLETNSGKELQSKIQCQNLKAFFSIKLMALITFFH